MAAVGSVWGRCTTCGAATAPGAATCPLCGAGHPLAAEEVQRAPARVRRRLRLMSAVRAAVVIGVIAALAAALVPDALSGPPTVADPLTTSGSYVLGPGASTALSGEITGGDYVLGNYSSVTPLGANVVLAVYNESGWIAFEHHAPATPVWSLPAQPSGRIVFSATTTETYAFVVSNPYPVGSGVSVVVYVVTQYESNVANDGFG